MANNPIDMICFNEECIQNKSQLFFYESEERLKHANHADEDCVNIHPHNFKRKYASQASALQETKAKFESSLQVTIAEIVEKFTQFLRNKLTAKASDVYDKALDEFRVGNCQNLLNKIKSDMQATYQISIMNCLFLEDLVGMRNHVTQKLEKSEELLTNYFRKLDSQLVDHFDKAINQFPKLEDSSKFDPQLQTEKTIKIEAETEMVVIQHEPTEMVTEQSRMIETPSEKAVEKEVENNKNIVNTFSLDLNDIRKFFKTHKTKPIHKISRMTAPVTTGFESFSPEDCSSENNATRSDTCTIRSDIDLLGLQVNSSSYQRLVFYYPLAEEDLVRIIRKATPKEVYINYQIKLSTDFLGKLPEPVLRQLSKFEEFWDYDEFFDEILNRQYFPIDDFRHIKAVNKLHHSYLHWNMLPRLSNIWISSSFDLEQLKLSRKRLGDIDSLRIERCKCCNNLSQYVISEIFSTFRESSSLKTLILKCDVLNAENTRLLRELTQNNRKIRCVAIEAEGKYIPRRILECFSHLPLTKLSINSERITNGLVYMDVTPIVKIKTLKKLALTNMQFTVKEHLLSEKKEDEYIELDDQACDKIVELPELAFLDLSRCSPVYPSVVADLPEKVKSRLYHLNLSHTFMDNSLIAELNGLPQLSELNLDRTTLVLKDLFRELGKKPLRSVTSLSLFNYNGDDLDEVDEIEDFTSQIKFSDIGNGEIEKIAACFPNLEYLNIAFCRHFTELPEFKFKKLRHLCSNREFMSPAKVERMKHQRGIEVYLYDGVYPAWVVPQQQKK